MIIGLTDLEEVFIKDLNLQFLQIYKVNSLLGSGAFGVVLEVTNLISKENSALKIICKRDQSVYNVLIKELDILRELSHPNIVRFKQILHSPDFAFIEMEKMNGGTLQELLNKHPQGLEECTAAAIMKDILQGLCSIHDKNYIHRDLKPDNILLNAISAPGEANVRYQAKIADFGLSAEIKYGIFSGQNQIDDRMGTTLYMAPEQAQGQLYGKRVDMWALGIIMYIMLTGTHPFVKDSDNEYSYSNRIASSDLQVSKNLQPIAKSLFQHLCSRTLSERYQAAQAIKHPWITRNPHDEVPCTQADQMRIMEASTFFKRAQSALLFMAVAKVSSESSIGNSLSTDYLKRIEECSAGESVTSGDATTNETQC
ncbi:hypothetical protein FGO68_gene5560 [Halteria grandinella]|uniref:Protein kinase domain-containing protein n=1 Tax=Halteria grandinella TaxID=5974 RepID=A0A8J8NH40_HALGN|nr:hypothetical protein FGO68_gene5560 [Halteria grandinella]